MIEIRVNKDLIKWIDYFYLIVEFNIIGQPSNK